MNESNSNQALKAFLDGLNLGQYFDAMVAEDLTLATLKDLEDADLRELGFSMGHRKELRRALKDDAPAAPSPTTTATTIDERRQVTIFFCDLVGSTELAGRYDAEDMAEILGRYHQLTAKIIAAHLGRGLGTQGDGVVACFGYPKAAENDAARAVEAALEISRAVANMKFDDGLVLKSRVGVATGRVFVRGNVEESSALVGDTLNFASRLQDAAESNTVVVASNTQKLIKRSAMLEPLGARSLKGFETPVEIWRVDGLRDVAVSKSVKGARLLGRKSETTRLSTLWQTAKDGQGQALILSGGAGIGKSALMETVRDMAKADDALIVHYYCAPGYENSALYPIRSEIARSVGIQDDDGHQDITAKLRAWAGTADKATVRMLADLLSLDPGADHPPLDMTATEQKGATYGLLLGQLTAQAKLGPIMIFLEDAHWADPTTLELLTLFVAQSLATLPILLVISHRPEVPISVGGFEHVSRMHLDRLSDGESRKIVKGIMGKQICPPDVLHKIVDVSDGIPLFLEELTRSVIDQQSTTRGGLSAVKVPITLEDSLMARLDRLSKGKSVVQAAAVLGRRFQMEPLRQTLSLAASDFSDAMSEPVEARILLSNEDHAPGSMIFRHALVQQAAYEGLALKKRQKMHEKIASLLLEHQPGIAGTEPETLARHFAGARKFEEAINYRLLAGKKATERGAQIEASNHYFAALENLANLPKGRPRDEQEVLLRALLGGALMATRGFAAPEVYDAFARARALCLALGDSPMYCSCLYGLFTVEASRSNKDAAMALAAEMLATFAEAPVPSWQIAAHFGNGVAWFFAGDFDRAADHFDKAIAIYTPDQHGLLVEQFGDNLTEFSMCYRSWIHLLRGEIDASAQMLGNAENMANALNNKNAQTRSLAFQMGRMMDLQSAEGVAALAPKVIETSTTQGYPYWACAGQIGLGWSLAIAGQEDGLLPITGSLEFFDMIGQRTPQTYWRTALIAAHVALNDRQPALDAAQKALEMSRSGLDSAFEASILWRQGQALMLEPSDAKAAKASLSEALAISQQFGMHLYALYSAAALAEVLILEGRAEEEGGSLARAIDAIQTTTDFDALSRACDTLSKL